jgi:predicted transcriptional regulator YdeE
MLRTEKGVRIMSHLAEPATGRQRDLAKPEPRIEQKGAFRVAGLRYEGRREHSEIPALWDRFIPRADELIGDPSHFVAYGVARALPNFPEGDTFEYLAGTKVASLDNLPTGMVGWEIPALTYAVLPAHDVPDIGPVSDYFHREWLPQSQEYETGEGLMIEHYPETYSRDLIIYL